MGPFEVSGWRSQGHLFQGPLHVWGLAQGLPATQEQAGSTELIVWGWGGAGGPHPTTGNCSLTGAVFWNCPVGF